MRPFSINGVHEAQLFDGCLPECIEVMVKMGWLCHVTSSIAVGATKLIPIGFGCLDPGGHAGDGCSQDNNQDHKVRLKLATSDPPH